MHNKVLIFIVAYNAKNHIRSVFDRLPKVVFNNPDFHILVVDDCSKDNTAEVAGNYVKSLKFQNVTVLRNNINQGYGGNQKIGYRYAVKNGYGLAILLHGDGQYAPELVLEFVKRWKEEKAEVILGSRMMDKSQARRGGMPFYKWIGNQVLTRFQNLMVGSGLSEFHTGYRAYDTGLLSKIPFELDTNEFHFDTEILLQAFALKAKVAEFSIPTHYGDEICHVNGMQYAWDVAKACTKYRFQKIGFFCSMQYRGLLNHKESDLEEVKNKGSLYHYTLDSLESAQSVLVLGEQSPIVAQSLNSKQTALIPFEKILNPKDVSQYDAVLALGVLEKLNDAERFLVDCRYNMTAQKQPKFIFSAKNTAFFGLRILLGIGYFNYGERGILTMETRRLFTLSSLKRILKETGYELVSVKGFGLPFHLLSKGPFIKFLGKFSNFLAKTWPSLFAYEFVVEAKPKQHTLMLLEKAETFYEPKYVKNTESAHT